MGRRRLCLRQGSDGDDAERGCRGHDSSLSSVPAGATRSRLLDDRVDPLDDFATLHVEDAGYAKPGPLPVLARDEVVAEVCDELARRERLVNDELDLRV